MSGFAIVLQRDRGAHDDGLLDRMLAAADYRGPDGVTRLQLGPVALGHLRLSTTVEEAAERQPLADADGQVVVLLDGRIDDRDALRATLIARGARLRDDTDAELVLAGYSVFGDDLPGRLSGDFALAIWDARRRSLLCARDILGCRPFHYYVDRDVFIAASDLVQVLQHRAIRREPNEGLIGETLSNARSNQAETLFRDVSRLPPGHLLRVDATSVAVTRYWSPDEVVPIHHTSDGAYAEHFEEVLDAAVRDCLRGTRPVGLDLSGGLDSSSVAAVARALEADGRVASGLFTLSSVYPGKPHDERSYIRAVAERWPGEHHELPVAPKLAAESDAQAQRFLDLPGPPNSTTAEDLSFTRRCGARVRLTGVGGDDFLDPLTTTSRGVELLRAGAFRQLAGFSWPTLGHIGLRAPFAMFGGESALRSVRRVVRPLSLPSWIDRGFAARHGLIERLEHARPGIAGFARAERAYPLTMDGNTLYLEIEERLAALGGCELRHPLMHRRVVELCLGLPVDQLVRGDQTKFVLRNAMRNRLPDRVRARRDKATFNELSREAVVREAPESSIARLRIARLGWVDSDKLIAEYRRRRPALESGGAVDGAFLQGMWMLYAIEKWLTASFDEGRP